MIGKFGNLMVKQTLAKVCAFFFNVRVYVLLMGI